MNKTKKPKIKGCKPQWYDGILGWSWHCTCDDNKHGCDQQCSAIVKKKEATKQNLSRGA